MQGGTFEIEIGGQTINIDLANDVETKIGNTAENNAKALLKAINEKIENDPSLTDIKDKLKSGEITIGLNSTGKGLLFNDSKGGEINVNITDAKVKVIEGGSEVDTDLGFVKTSVGASSTDLITSSAVSSSALSGIITINGEKIDLSGINNGSGAGNAQAVADKINATANLNGKVSAEVKNGKLVINSLDGNSVRIGAEGANSEEQTKVLNSVGLQMGSYATSQGFLEKMDITNIQKAQNAQFTYNGIEIERDKNSVDDVVSGLSLELTAITEANKEVVVRISRDDSGIAEEMEKFVENYNTMYNKIQELMRYDEDTEVAGVFNGNSDIRQIIRQFNSIITSNDINGDNLVKFGIYFNDDGTLKMDKEKFNSAFKEDPDKAVAFFRSTTSVSRGVSTEVDGVFTKLRNTMDKLITGSNSTLKLLETSLVDEQKTLNEDKTKTQESIDSRYETMASRWSAYDQLIAKTQQQSLAVQNMINSLKSSN
ncbi:flagellar filament capping protein FliD [Helicobacter sp. UBA3407]|uniref:flagellar filament capping protein FliD n=1 Tax=Helicobacter sp. UBA3407 TaxID=1946588 RepID=UPI00261E754B|nr:flagellar filament capping protein FliD [Helicobacter sp. UBA3407]